MSTRASRTFSRLVRAARLRPARWRYRRGAVEDASYEVDVVTTHGRELGEALRELGEAAAGDDWTVADVQLSPPELRFEAGERSLGVRIISGEQEAYANTQYFSIVYRGARQLDADSQALVDRVVAAVRAAEDVRDTREILRRPSLSRVHYVPAEQRVEVRPSLVCNHSCGFCNSVDRTGTDNAARGIDDIIANLDLITALPITTVVISGGEPTLQKRLPELIAGFADRGVSVELQTNGMTLADPDYTARLVASGLRGVLVSLHAAKPKLSDSRITLLDGAWDRTVAGVDQAVRSRLTVHLSHVIHRQNADQTEAFLRFVNQRWGRKVYIRMAFVAPTGSAREQIEQYIPPIQDVTPHLIPALAYARREQVRMSFVGYCGIPPCMLQPEHEFSEITHIRGSRSYNADHIKLEACAGCRYEDRCPGLWSRYHEVHGDPGLRAMSSK